MKTPHWFNRNRFFSLVRIASAGHLSPPRPQWRSSRRNRPAHYGRNQTTKTRSINSAKVAPRCSETNWRLPGPEREGGSMAAAEEEYAKRAYPAAYVPFELTRNAHAAWSNVRTRALARAMQPLAQWTLVGPSSANFPDVLTFSGARYTTSGRVTGLALAPNCGQDHCNLYLAAAGGGIWKTDRALNTGPSQRWNFISGSFATNAIGTLVIDPTDPTGNTLYAGTGESHASADSEAGFGIYKTTDGGNTWTHLAGHTTCRPAQGLIALPYSVLAAFGSLLRTVGRLSMDGPSPRSYRSEQSECSLRWLGSCRARSQLRVKRRCCDSRSRPATVWSVEVH